MYLNATLYLSALHVQSINSCGHRSLPVDAVDGSLATDVFSPGFSNFHKAKPNLRIESDAFSKALFEIFLSPNSIVQDGRKAWTASALELTGQ